MDKKEIKQQILQILSTYIFSEVGDDALNKIHGLLDELTDDEQKQDNVADPLKDRRYRSDERARVIILEHVSKRLGIYKSDLYCGVEGLPAKVNVDTQIRTLEAAEYIVQDKYKGIFYITSQGIDFLKYFRENYGEIL